MAVKTRAQAKQARPEVSVGSNGHGREQLVSKQQPGATLLSSTQETYHVAMSLGFLVVATGVALALPFFLGRCARNYLSQEQSLLQLLSLHSDLECHKHLPPPTLGMYQELPASTSYTSKQYATRGTSSESFLSRLHGTTSSSSVMEGSNQTYLSSHYQSLSAMHQHAYVDLLLADHPALVKYTSSEARVVQLLNELLATSPTSTILSYHCHTVASQRISCTGIAPHGHVTVHTFPDRMSLDIRGISLDEETTRAILGRPLLEQQPASRQLLFPTATTSKPRSSSLLSTQSSSSLQASTTTSALVHPALLAHEDPKVVMLVGGSATTVKQILQHSTVERLILVEMMDANSVDDPRVTLHQGSCGAAEWFATHKDDMKGSVDVVLVEASSTLDPRNSTTIVHDVVRVLKDESLLVIQTSLESQQDRAHKLRLIDELSSAGDAFDAIREYDEGDANFLIAFVDDEVSFGRWFANEAEVNLAIRERVPSSIDYVDGNRMQRYQYPSRRAENSFCRANPEDDICGKGHGLDPSRPSVPISSFEVKVSTVENAGRGIYLKHDTEAGSYMFADGCVHNMHIPDQSVRILDDIVEEEYDNIPLKNWITLMWYADGYGFTSEQFGSRSYDVDSGIATFVNHGCNGTANVGSFEYEYLTENSGLSTIANHPITHFNPAQDRTVRSHYCTESIALRDMKRGEEVFNNYMTFEAEGDLEEYAVSLRAECSGKAFGQVSEYEMTHSHHDDEANSSSDPR